MTIVNVKEVPKIVLYAKTRNNGAKKNSSLGIRYLDKLPFKEEFKKVMAKQNKEKKDE